MTTTIFSTRKTILAKPEDWDTWFSFIRDRATGTRIWNEVNPEVIPRPANLQEPTQPEFQIPDNAADFDSKAYEVHKARMDAYKHQLAAYERQQKAYTDLIEFIHETITVQVALVVRKIESHPWNKLVALKQHLSPSDDARNVEIENKYRKVCQGPGRQDLEAWLEEWQATYIEAKEYGIGEVKGKRPQRDFLYAVRSKEPIFAESMLIGLKRRKNDDTDMLDLIEDFRDFIRLNLKRRGNTSTSHSAFAAGADGSSKDDEEPTFNGRKRVPNCLCGEAHYWSDCLYLNKDRRSSEWAPNASTKAAVDTAMKKKDVKSKIERALKKNKEYLQKKSEEEKKKNQQQNESKDKDVGAFTVVRTAFSAAFSTDHYSLRGSWILDNGSNSHVCNLTMKSRFKWQRGGGGDYLTAGTQRLSIEAYGTISITVPTPTGPQRMTLLNVAYVANFMTNLVSQDLLYVKGLYFDNWKLHLHRKGVTIATIKRYNGHYLMEDNVDHASIAASYPASVITTQSSSAKVATAYEWHQMLAHAFSEVIQHLEASAEGVKISDKDAKGNINVPKTNECESCALSKAHRVISRSPDNAETFTKPFYRVTYDLMQLTPALNKDEWISHFACHATDFNMVFTHQRKSEAIRIVREAINIIKTRFNATVVFFRSDGERSLGGEFDDLLVETGITHESSAPNSPEQNGHSERKGGILAMKARALRIDAGLPIFLWPELVCAAGYLANRTPMQKHGWKTPYELVIGQSPHLGHLHRYGCKAYTLNKHIPRKSKLQERAHIGHLVGYEARNIFLIWIPSQRKVIRTRAVIFDDDAIYDAHDIDLLQAVKEPMLETVHEAHHLDPITQITEIEYDEEVNIESIQHPKEIQGNQAAGKEAEGFLQGFLPTPSSTPASTPTPTSTVPPTPSSSRSASEAPINRAPTNEASRNGADFDAANILPEGVRRNRTRRQAYANSLLKATNGEFQAFHASFAAYITANSYYALNSTSLPAHKALTSTSPSSHRLHRDTLPLEPQHYGQMLNHPHAEGFKQAMLTEVNALKGKHTWKEVPYDEAAKEGKTPIPTMWVFKYKLDEQGYLVKYKARLCARGDLQRTEQDTFAATLAARIFRALMAIVAAFDLAIENRLGNRTRKCLKKIIGGDKRD